MLKNLFSKIILLKKLFDLDFFSLNSDILINKLLYFDHHGLCNYSFTFSNLNIIKVHIYYKHRSIFGRAFIDFGNSS